MTILRSRLAITLATGAAFAMTASPALARGYGGWGGGWHGHHRHHDRGIDGGDLLAGVLIVGGIAAIASAASKASRDKTDARERDASYPGSDDRPGYGSDSRYDPRDRGVREPDGSGYGADRSDDQAGDYGARDRVDTRFDDAAQSCTSEIERGDREVDRVESVDRRGDRYSVTGRLSDGRPFACSVDDDGRIRSVAVDGRAA